MKNCLSFDLEFWHSGEPYSKHLPEKVIDHVEEDIRPILHLLKKHNTKATFFTLGNLAEKYPDTKVIIITGFAEELTAEDDLDRGAFAFFPKPFRIEDIKQVIKQTQKE